MEVSGPPLGGLPAPKGTPKSLQGRGQYEANHPKLKQTRASTLELHNSLPQGLWSSTQCSRTGFLQSSAHVHEIALELLQIYTDIYIYIYTRSSCALRAHSDRRGPVGHAPWIRTRKRNRWMRRIRRQIKIHKTRKEGGGDAGSGPPETQKTWPEWWSRNPQISSNGPEKSLVFEVEGSGSVWQFSWCSTDSPKGKRKSQGRSRYSGIAQPSPEPSGAYRPS